MATLQSNAGPNEDARAGESGAQVQTREPEKTTTTTTGPANADAAPVPVSNDPADQSGGFESLMVDSSSDRDSAYWDGSDAASFTTSLDSTATDYKFEHGRRYHAYGGEKYYLPNDDEEIDRLEFQHRLWQQALNGRLSLAPLNHESLRRALDLGCGTGAWTIEFAVDHPHCHVSGIDLSPIQPTMVPPNLDFTVDDFSADWVYPYRFDYVHSRLIVAGVRDWRKLVADCWGNLEPGGWVEFQEHIFPFTSDDGSMEECPRFKLWNEMAYTGASRVGLKLDIIVDMATILEAQGFINVGQYVIKIPLGHWAKGRKQKVIGEAFARNLIRTVEGGSMRVFTKVLGWTEEEVKQLAQDVEVEVRSGKMHAYAPIVMVWGQKPPQSATNNSGSV